MQAVKHEQQQEKTPDVTIYNDNEGFTYNALRYFFQRWRRRWWWLPTIRSNQFELQSLLHFGSLFPYYNWMMGILTSPSHYLLPQAPTIHSSAIRRRRTSHVTDLDIWRLSFVWQLPSSSSWYFPITALRLSIMLSRVIRLKHETHQCIHISFCFCWIPKRSCFRRL